MPSINLTGAKTLPVFFTQALMTRHRLRSPLFQIILVKPLRHLDIDSCFHTAYTFPEPDTDASFTNSSFSFFMPKLSILLFSQVRG